MSNTDFNYDDAVDPTTGLPYSKSMPVPGLLHAAIPGIVGVAQPGVWDRGGKVFGDMPKAAPAPAPADHYNMLGEKEEPPPSIPSPVKSPDEVPNTVRRFGLDVPYQAPKTPFPDAPPELIGAADAGDQTPTTKRSDQAPGEPLAIAPQENAGGRPGFVAQNEGYPRTSGMLGDLFHNAHNWVDQRRMTLMALAGGLAGAQSIGQGLGRGFTAAASTFPQQNALNNQNMTMQALIDRGYDPDTARAAAGNPAILQQIAPMAFGAKNWDWEQIGTDRYGNPIKGFVNKVTMQVKDEFGRDVSPGPRGTIGAASGAGPQGTPGTPAAGSPDANGELHGEAYLQQLAAQDPKYADTVRAIGMGKGSLPSGRLLNSPYGRALQEDVRQAYPDFNFQTPGARVKAWNDWYGGGKHADAVGAIGQAATHGYDLVAGEVGSFDSLGNISGGWLVNKPLNALGEATGLGASGANYDAVKMNVHALADELSKIWKGSGSNSDAEIDAWESKFPVDGTPEQQRNAMLKAVALYRGGIEKLEQMKRDEFGAVGDSLPPVTSPQVAARIQAMDDWAHGRKPGAIPPAGQAAAAPAGGRQAPIVHNDQEWSQLPKGAPYMDMFGNLRVKQ